MTTAKRVASRLSKGRRREPVDEHAARNLKLYIENTYELYNQKKSILANLKKRVDKGTYDPVLAAKLWLYWVDAGAKLYVKQMGDGVFNKSTREHVAAELAKTYNPARLRDEY
jgi:hypothetical protein